VGHGKISSWLRQHLRNFANRLPKIPHQKDASLDTHAGHTVLLTGDLKEDISLCTCRSTGTRRSGFLRPLWVILPHWKYVVRATVLLVVLALGGESVTSLICSLFCAEHAGTQVSESCHESAATDGAQIGHSGHDCDHSIASVPFLSRAVTTPGTPHDAVTQDVSSFGQVLSRDAADARSDSPPGRFLTPLSTRLTVLRI
jgi:hypothetical protein